MLRVLSAPPMLWRWKRLASASDGGDEEDAVAFLEGAGFAAEEADVFFVEVDVEELADLALVVADVAPEIGEARSELVAGFGDGSRFSVYFRRAVGEAPECGGDFDGDGHLFKAPCSLRVFSS